MAMPVHSLPVPEVVGQAIWGFSGPGMGAPPPIGNQVAVFGRIGSRPFTLIEQRRFYLQNGNGVQYRVSDERPIETATENP